MVNPRSYRDNSTYEQKYDYLRRRGFTSNESESLAGSYSLSHFVELPYFKRLTRDRQLYVGRLRALGYTDRRIRNALKRQYKRRNCDTIYDMVRYFRGISIALGEYIPIKRKGSHHPTKGKFTRETARNQRRRLTSLERYEEGRGR